MHFDKCFSRRTYLLETKNKKMAMKMYKNNKMLTLEHAKKVAQRKRGKCLSAIYENIDVKLKWECKFKHQWHASLYSIKNLGSWCPHCAGVAKLAIADMRQLAEKRKGKCLSTVYINSDTPLTWQCEFGHQWDARPNSIKNKKSWCPDCAGRKKLSLDDMHKIATDRGGWCLSTEYKNNRSKLLWLCSRGHKWKATLSSVKNRGTWCPYCGGSKKLTIQEMRDLAEIREGKCLSESYVNARTKLLWQCSKGHQWFATPDKIKYTNRWCKLCII